MSSASLADSEARRAAYRLFSHLALQEVDDTLGAALVELPILGEAYQTGGGARSLVSLRVDYARTFLMLTPPYESVYVDDEGALNGPSSSAVLAHFEAAGWHPSALASVGAPDHLGLELLFLALLEERRQSALAVGNQGAARGFLEEQGAFLEEHLLRWGPIFGTLLRQHAASPLYRAYGGTLSTFLLNDYEHLGVA
ncbi:MAG: molecular chaperone TorD family protein [Chloroflexi bacterium]|nr:molecular chaperone TorD family protein [Chloroflexota bacterium]